VLAAGLVDGDAHAAALPVALRPRGLLLLLLLLLLATAV
jgi:hypothetical protein